jgi:polar amino acid transport system substrate-binding protein
MLQLAQKLKNGIMQVIETPWPTLETGKILVRNHYSLISAGTESSTVKTARKSLIGKAKERPQQLKQVIDVLKSQGPLQTYRAVMKKLDALSPLGYSCVGEVIEVASDVSGFSAGDMVACGGLTACHAEVVSVPLNLCVKVELSEMIEREKHLKMAAYNTLGAIAMQGVRQADLRLGESCAVIGLGLVGQLTCLLLRASGIRVVGLDIDEASVNTAIEHCVDAAYVSERHGVAERMAEFTQGLGCDAVIIAAGTTSLKPINLAGQIARKKGRVVVAGVVPTGFDRDPFYYRKELELRMSCSYGPGRYDLDYEEKGHDYPPAYVRWTENRNMQAFQELIRTGRIDLEYLTTHEFSLNEAPKAYDMIVQRSEEFTGILIRYDVEKPLLKERIKVGKTERSGKITYAFIGAGSYAQGSLLPNLPKNNSDVVSKGVLTSSGTSSRSVAEKFGFAFCTSDKSEIIDNDEINTLFISTRHNTHAEYVLDGLQAGKNIFVEKPLCLTVEEFAEIEGFYSSNRAAAVTPPLLMVGFNRRFAPLAVRLKEKLSCSPVSMVYRVNAGAIPADSWIQHKDIGGGRILGEVCHFIDFMTYVSGSLPVRVYASVLPDSQHLKDTVVINLEFSNGSIGSIAYFANGAQGLSKEHIEVYQGGLTGIIHDFKELHIHNGGKPEKKKLMGQDKGQKDMIAAFIDALLKGSAAPIDVNEIFAVTRATFAVIRSMQKREVVSLGSYK